MRVAVVGLGVEGRSALKSLLDRNMDVYASDLDLDIPIEPQDGLEIDLGFHNFEKIRSADAVVISPSLWNLNSFKSFQNNDKLLSDVFTHHKSTLTIGVTGTNGKTTTCLMITSILQKAGYKVLVGGNAGGGFHGYTEIILEAENNDYDVMVVEVCDMTLNFCRGSFDLDLVVVTNQGKDHLDIHQSQNNYLNSLREFIMDKETILNQDDPLLVELGKSSSEVHYFHKDNERKLKLFGKFNQENAAASAKVAEVMGIRRELVDEVLGSFKGVVGRTEIMDISGSKLVIGKTDNVDAVQAVMREVDFQVAIVGTPRRNEPWRFEILKEIEKHQPQIIALFPGLDNTVAEAKKVLENYTGQIVELDNNQEVMEFAKKSLESNLTVFLGGNGQENLMRIRRKLLENDL
ncbi:UDP-N-acetylmuramoyl-L-alanine--D-glutamate ligase [Methanobacterium sp. CWC-01]|uniref:Mur ligase family protein n=1 Tax=Methanobacterium aridiramus TaxID=2584467 RepID=UPI0025751436|nr:Mur ligase family protein [Methanobacterium sp. CWC-01]WJI09112.1 UDP-N-acetylmuramoyl-L-alanine--D-glutamate ligase [Methanobacterium sp. CWC-01]